MTIKNFFKNDMIIYLTNYSKLILKFLKGINEQRRKAYQDCYNNNQFWSFDNFINKTKYYIFNHSLKK